ncbi:hypothetical protein Baya_8577 [Bagarius yarrelli]|uniref:Uncharacterized protein n=1 Tax=Bagarius yarrelli TaxID=175774 RepID=A0A556U4D6_BAGYA|nr:hypothetical protein Baya_8577 [Bagarius yarrelli]
MRCTYSGLALVQTPRSPRIPPIQWLLSFYDIKTQERRWKRQMGIKQELKEFKAVINAMANYGVGATGGSETD